MQAKLANFLITSGPIFNEKTTLFKTGYREKNMVLKMMQWNNIAGTYKLAITSSTRHNRIIHLDVKSSNAASCYWKRYT